MKIRKKIKFKLPKEVAKRAGKPIEKAKPQKWHAKSISRWERFHESIEKTSKRKRK